MFFRRSLIVAFAVAGSSAAFAADLGVAKDFNAFIFGSANTQGGHSAGAIAVGGSWSGHYEVKQNAFPQVPYPSVPGTTNLGLYVGGSIASSGGDFKVLQGNAYIGGGVSGTFQMLNGFQQFAGTSASVFTSQQAYSLGQSAAISAMSGVQLNTSDPNNINVDLSANVLNGNTKVYWVNSSNITGLKTLNFNNGSASDTVLINVLGSSSIDWGWSINYAHKNKVLFNFVDTATLNVKDRDFSASILAPKATVNQNMNIEGNLIAANWNNFGSRELHFGNQFMFNGNAPVPEPATLAILGVGAAALIRRRRKS